MLPGWQAVGWTMIHFLWIGTLIGLVALIGRLALHRCRPLVRYVFLIGCFAVLVAAPWPILWHLLGAPALISHQESTSVEQAVESSLPAGASDTESVVFVPGFRRVSDSAPFVSPPAHPTEHRWQGNWKAWLGQAALVAPWVWLIGTPLTLLLVCCGYAGTRHLRRHSQPLPEPWVVELTDRLSLALHLGREVIVALSDRVASPILIGVIKPMILLPPALISGCTSEQIEMVLLHELAHVRRWDLWVNLFQQIAEGLLFFHPVVWIVSRWIRHERESCCDEIVLQQTGEPQTYAETLAHLARPDGFPLVSSVAMAQHPLVRRIQCILQWPDHSLRLSPALFMGLMLVFLTGLAMAIGMTRDQTESVLDTERAPAPEAQWLKYRAEPQEQILGEGEMGVSKPEVTTQRPARVELPRFEAEQPYFAQWSTPMVESGRLWMALDRTSENGPWDRLFIDANGDGHLNDENAALAYHRNGYYAYFGPVKLVFEGEDGPVTYHLNFRIRSPGGRAIELFAYSGCWYEGMVTVGGVKKHCVLIDKNANGTFNDQSLNAADCDRIRFGQNGERDATLFAGNYLELDGVLYQPEIARDGAYIKMSKAEDVKFGNVRVPQSITEFSVGGENGLFAFKPKERSGSLPVGKYRINHWVAERKDEQGNQWKLQGSAFNNNGLFEVTEGGQVHLDIGEPFICTLETSNSGLRHSFNRKLKGHFGERILLTRNGDRPPAPRLRIKNRDGTYDRIHSFEYG